MAEIENTDEKKAFFERAQDALSDAVDTTIEAVKEHPVAAASIAAGAAAAVAGAAFGASKLLGDNDNKGSAKKH